MYGPQIGEKSRRDHYLRSTLVCGSKKGPTETHVMIGDLVSLDKCHPELGGRFIVRDITAVRSDGSTGSVQHHLFSACCCLLKLT